MSEATAIVDLSEAVVAGANVVEASLTLDEPQTRVRVRVPAAANAGRAEAVFVGASWAAKHYFREGEDVVVYEFDEALPAGPVLLRIPVARS